MNMRDDDRGCTSRCATDRSNAATLQLPRCNQCLLLSTAVLGKRAKISGLNHIQANCSYDKHYRSSTRCPQRGRHTILPPRINREIQGVHAPMCSHFDPNTPAWVGQRRVVSRSHAAWRPLANRPLRGAGLPGDQVRPHLVPRTRQSAAIVGDLVSVSDRRAPCSLQSSTCRSAPRQVEFILPCHAGWPFNTFYGARPIDFKNCCCDVAS